MQLDGQNPNDLSHCRPSKTFSKFMSLAEIDAWQHKAPEMIYAHFEMWPIGPMTALFTLINPISAFCMHFSDLHGPDSLTNGLHRSSTSTLCYRTLEAVAFNAVGLLFFQVLALAYHGASDQLVSSGITYILKCPRRFHAGTTLACLFPPLYAVSCKMGVGVETVLLLTLMGAVTTLTTSNAQVNRLVRLGAFALACRISFHASLRIISGAGTPISANAQRWITILSLAIFTAVPIWDQEGMGKDLELKTRISLALTIISWTIVSAMTLGLAKHFWIPLVLQSGETAWKLLFGQEQLESRETWVSWCIWTGMLCLAPLLRLVQDAVVG